MEWRCLDPGGRLVVVVDIHASTYCVSTFASSVASTILVPAHEHGSRHLQAASTNLAPSASRVFATEGTEINNSRPAPLGFDTTGSMCNSHSSLLRPRNNGGVIHDRGFGVHTSTPPLRDRVVLPVLIETTRGGQARQLNALLGSET